MNGSVGNPKWFFCVIAEKTLLESLLLRVQSLWKTSIISIYRSNVLYYLFLALLKQNTIQKSI